MPAIAREHGLELQMIGRNAIRAQYPWFGEKVIGASLAAMDGQANPRVVAPAYARLARRLGVDVREQTAVTAARRTEARLRDRGRRAEGGVEATDQHRRHGRCQDCSTVR